MGPRLSGTTLKTLNNREYKLTYGKIKTVCDVYEFINSSMHIVFTYTIKYKKASG
jgi:hypothetical protein